MFPNILFIVLPVIQKLKSRYMLILYSEGKEGQFESTAQTNKMCQWRGLSKKIQDRKRVPMCKYSLYHFEEETSGKYL